MVVPNPVFDALLFGLLALAAVLDSTFPVLHGAASLLVIVGASYWAAQELADVLLRRAGWSQDSLATSIALCVGGFIYFWWRNQSDLVLLALSIGLMMGSLMVAISIISAIGSVLREGNGTPVAGWLATALGALFLGLLAGVLALTLGAPQETLGIVLKLGVVFIAYLVWKGREVFNPPAANPHFHNLEAQKSVGVAPPLQQARWALFPQRGTTLDRLLPLFVLGVVLLAASQWGVKAGAPFSNAVAAPSQAP